MPRENVHVVIDDRGGRGCTCGDAAHASGFHGDPALCALVLYRLLLWCKFLRSRFVFPILLGCVSQVELEGRIMMWLLLSSLSLCLCTNYVRYFPSKQSRYQVPYLFLADDGCSVV